MNPFQTTTPHQPQQSQQFTERIVIVFVSVVGEIKGEKEALCDGAVHLHFGPHGSRQTGKQRVQSQHEVSLLLKWESIEFAGLHPCVQFLSNLQMTYTHFRDLIPIHASRIKGQ